MKFYFICKIDIGYIFCVVICSNVSYKVLLDIEV